jgi:hypothetical protein
MERDEEEQRSLDEARERSVRDTARSRGALAWGAVLLAGLAFIAVVIYWIYRAFSTVIEQRGAAG